MKKIQDSKIIILHTLTESMPRFSFVSITDGLGLIQLKKEVGNSFQNYQALDSTFMDQQCHS